jgi:hypothetical protein
MGVWTMNSNLNYRWGANIVVKILNVLLVIIVSTSCATKLKPLENNHELNQSTAIIFGKSEFFMDGQLIDYKGTYFSYTKRIIYHISPFISDSQLNKSRWRPGEYAFASIGNEGGYFV